MEETVLHQTINGKYRIVIERAASTKGVDGFKVEANGDDIEQVKKDVADLYDYAIGKTDPLKVEFVTPESLGTSTRR